jgi:hypothetical protein
MNLNGNFRAHERAESATGTFAIILENHRMESIRVEFVGGHDVALFTGSDAEVAFLANSPVYVDSAFQYPYDNPRQ